MHADISPFRAFTRQHLRIAAILVGSLNLLFMAGTLVFGELFDRLPGGQAAWEKAPYFMKYILDEFTLVTENVVAVWYSSMLLLVVTILAALCFFVNRQEAIETASPARRRLLGGWFIIALIFALLSLDEMGSLHEGFSRIVLEKKGWGYDFFLAPIALIGSYLLGFGWLNFRRNRKAMILMAVGILLFLTVPLYENWEAVITQPHLLNLEHTMEEGTECFGMMACICGLGAFLVKATADGKQITVPRSLAMVLALSLVGAMAVGVGIVHFLSYYIPFGSAGIEGLPWNWFPSAMALLTAVLCERIYSLRRGVLAYRVLALLCLMVSAYFGANYDGYLYDGLLGLDKWTLLFHLTLIATVAAVATSLFVRSPTRWSRWGITTWAVLFTLALWAGMPHVATESFVAFAALFLALIAHLPAADREGADRVTLPRTV
jgi:hypothetical protein